MFTLKIGDLYRTGEIFSTKYFCNAKVAGLDEIVHNMQYMLYESCCIYFTCLGKVNMTEGPLRLKWG